MLRPSNSDIGPIYEQGLLRFIVLSTILNLDEYDEQHGLEGSKAHMLFNGVLVFTDSIPRQ